jgi:hypothetical protein
LFPYICRDLPFYEHSRDVDGSYDTPYKGFTPSLEGLQPAPRPTEYLNSDNMGNIDELTLTDGKATISAKRVNMLAEFLGKREQKCLK